MSDKKYYWLKLKKDFFKRHDIQIVEAMPNGKDYILFYLKMLVESVDHDGNLRFNDTIPYNEPMLATITNTNIDIVKSAMKLFTDLDMIDVLENETIFMTEVEKMMGTETYWAEQKRKQRIVGQCPKDVQLLSNVSNQELDIDIDIDKELDKDKKPTIPKLTKTEIVINTYTSNKDLHIAITDFIVMRKKLRKPMTDRALELMLKKLIKISTNDTEKIEILNNSIMNCYQGIWPLKKEGASNGFARQDTQKDKRKWADYKPPKPNNKPLTESESKEPDPI